jgi:uncharacterized protein YycO
MHQIIFHFHRGNKPLSRAIRFFSQGKFNHVSIQIGEDVWESHIDCGVRKVKEDWSGRLTIKESIPINTDKKDLVIKWLDKQVGKKYDIWGALSVVWRMFRQGKDKWYCSEYAFVALMKSLNISSKVGYNQRQSPQEFYQFLKVIKQIL